MANNEVIKEQLEMVDVAYEDNNQKLNMIFLDEAEGEIREVTFNRQSYDQTAKKFVDDPAKATKVDEWCEEYFQLPFDAIGQAIGVKKDIYCYDNFNSLFPVKMIAKFDEDYLGLIFETEIVEAVDDGKKISLQFEYEGKLYESKMQYADFLESRQEWFVNPTKRKKQFDKFTEKFQLHIDQLGEMVGKTVMIEVKKAYGKYYYAEIKPFKKVKK